MNRTALGIAAAFAVLAIAAVAYWMLPRPDPDRPKSSTQTSSSRGHITTTAADLSPPPGLEAGVVSGRVRSTAEALPTEIIVRAHRADALWWEGDLEPLATARAAEDGQFRLEGLPQDSLYLSIEAPGFAPLGRQIDLRSPGGGRIGLDLVLEPCPSLSGTIRDPAGRALAGAEVVVLERRGPNLLGSGLPKTTDARGQFELTSIPPGRIALYVRHPSFVPLLEEPVVPGQTDLLLQLPEHGASLTLQLLERESAETLASHAVSVRDLDILAPGTSRWRTAADENGVARFPNLRPGPHQVVAEPSDTHDGKEAVLELSPGEQSESLDLPQTSVMRVQVLDGRARRRLPRSEVRFEQLQGPFDRRIEADERGRLSFRFPVRSLSPYEIRLGGRDWILSAPEMPDGALLVPPGEGPPAHIVPLTALPSARLRGVVTDPQGEPVTGAEVIAVRRTPQGVSELGRGGTGSDGSFLLAPLPAHEDVYLWAQGGRSGPTELGPIETRSGHLAGPVPVRLDTGGRLAGRVVDETGAGIFGAHVVARSSRPKAGWSESGTSTDATGHFVLEGLPLMQLDVVATFGALAPGHQTVGLDRAGNIDDLVVTMGPPTILRGRVENTEGSPRAGARVVLFSDDAELARTRTDATGTFRFSGLEPGTYRVQTGPEGSVFSRQATSMWRSREGSHARETSPGDEPVVLSYPDLPFADVTFRLLLDDGAPPPKRATLELQPLPESGPPLRVGLSDLGREVRLEGLDPGRYRLTLQPAGYVPRSHEIDIEASQELDLGAWSFARGRTVRGRVLDETGRPLPGAAVVALETPRPRQLDLQVANVTAARDGRFELSGVSSDVRYLYTRAPGHAPVSQPLPPGDEPVEIHLPQAARLEIVLPDATGSPEMRQLRVFELFEGEEMLIAEREFNPSVQRTRLEDLPVATFRVELEQGDQTTRREVSAEAGETVEVDFGESGR